MEICLTPRRRARYNCEARSHVWHPAVVGPIRYGEEAELLVPCFKTTEEEQRKKKPRRYTTQGAKGLPTRRSSICSLRRFVTFVLAITPA